MMESLAVDKGWRLQPAWRWLFGIAFLAALGLWVQATLGWQRVLLPWAFMPLQTLFWAWLLVLLSHCARGARVYEQYRVGPRFAFLPLLRLTIIHTSINNLLPMRLGELAFPLLMKRYFNEGLARSGLTLLWIRLLDLHFLGCVFLLLFALRAGGWAWLAPLGWVSGLVPVHFARGRLAARLRGRPGRLPALLRLTLEQIPARFGQHVLCYVWTAVSWSAKVYAFTLILLHFIGLPSWQAVLGVIGGELSSVLPVHGIAGTGSYEAAVVLALLPFGASHDQALLGAVNLHLFLLASTSILGLLALLLPVRRAAKTLGS
jgi:uncharacterized membrane protein YbhN (UPF0104 family)